jgi:hypothetical protein
MLADHAVSRDIYQSGCIVNSLPEHELGVHQSKYGLVISELLKTVTTVLDAAIDMEAGPAVVVPRAKIFHALPPGSFSGNHP